MNFINWGNETPEQLAIRRRLEQDALYEQAVRMAQARQRAGQAPAVAGGGGDPLAGLYGVGSKEGLNEYELYSLGRSQAKWQVNAPPAPELIQATLNTDDGYLYGVVDFAGSVSLVRIDRKTREVEFIPNNISDFVTKGASSFYYEGMGSFVYLDNSNKKSISSIVRVQLGGSPEFAEATELAEVDPELSGYLLRNLFLYEGSPWAIAYAGSNIITGPIDLETGEFSYNNLILPSPKNPTVQSIEGVFSTVEYRGKVWLSAVWSDGDGSYLGLFTMDTETGGALAPYYLTLVQSLENWSTDNVAILSLTHF